MPKDLGEAGESCTQAKKNFIQARNEKDAQSREKLLGACKTLVSQAMNADPHYLTTIQCVKLSLALGDNEKAVHYIFSKLCELDITQRSNKTALFGLMQYFHHMATHNIGAEKYQAFYDAWKNRVDKWKMPKDQHARLAVTKKDNPDIFIEGIVAELDTAWANVDRSASAFRHLPVYGNLGMQPVNGTAHEVTGWRNKARKEKNRMKDPGHESR